MNACEKIQDYFVEALYEELEPTQKTLLEGHFQECPACAAEFQAMRSTLAVMSRRERPEADEKDWESFDRKLQQRIQESKSKGRVLPFRRVPGWILQVAAALILVGAGVIIGRFFAGDEASKTQVVAVAPKQKPPVQTVAAETEAQRFLEKSEVLLLGVVNTDPDEEASSLDLDRRKQVSNDLIHQAALVKGQLKDPRQRRLRELVSDLELILVQIASLEEQEDQPEIEVVKSGVDRKGLLLKIDIEQMRLSNPKFAKPAAAKKSAEPGI